MTSRRLAKAIGWAFAYFVGGGLLFLICAAVLIAWTGLPEPPEALQPLMLGSPLLFFSCIAVYHESTGKLPRTNQVLRTTALFVLWPLIFYFCTLGPVVLILTFANLGSALGIPIFAPALAGGAAASLCWRGKLPGTRAIGSIRSSRSPNER